jgi:hypothetical protein
MRVDDGRYKAFLQDAAAVVPKPRIFTGEGHTISCRALKHSIKWPLNNA